MTLARVAERAGVSTATVSRVLNERPGVSETTRRDVLLALEVLGYERPASLRRKDAGVVGVIVPELVNPVFPAFANALEEFLSRNGYTQMLCSQHLGGIHEDEHVRRLVDRGVAGIIFLAGIHAIHGTSSERYETLRSSGLPMVFVNGFLPNVHATFISVDDVCGVQMAVRHLRDLGHVRIGLAIGPGRYTTARRKEVAFRAEMSRPDAVPPLVERSVFSVEGGALAAESLLQRGATALVCGSDLMALGAVRAVRAQGLDVPGDVSVVGCDDSLLMPFTDPPLTTVRQPVVDMAGDAVRALLEQVSGGEAPTGELLFRPDLVLRGSTARAAGPTEERKTALGD